MACDNEACSNSSWNYYATTQDWAISYHAPPPLISDNTTLPDLNNTVERPPVVVEAPQITKPVAVDSTALKP